MRQTVLAIAAASVYSVLSFALADQPSGAVSDDRFVAKAATGDATELELGKLALQRTDNADLKAYVQQIINDHAAADKELLALAGRKRIVVPKTVDSKQRDAISKLSKLNGAEFDRAFASQMVKDHKMVVELFRSEAEHGTDPDLKAYATKVLPTLKEHLRLARELSGEKATESKSTASKSQD